VALGTINNGAGAAGTGGQVADPILIKVDGSNGAIFAAIVLAQRNGADIISMSFGGTCDDWCRAGHDLGGLDAYIDDALDAGILLVASAGNDGFDVANSQIFPCYYNSSNSGNSVYCVGALNPIVDSNGYYLGTDVTAARYSNFGSAVNIWAPTNIRAMPDGSSNGQLVVHSGTSASAPYVAGVAAMMKAINPGLDGPHIKNIIGNGPFVQGTSCINPDCPGFRTNDEKVSYVIQPYNAVVAAAGGYHLPPVIHITTPQNGSSFASGGFEVVKFTASAIDVNDGTWPNGHLSDPSYGGTPIGWSSDVDGPLGSGTLGGTSFSHDFTLAAEGSAPCDGESEEWCGPDCH
jgi:subtilisin family serine protease